MIIDMHIHSKNCSDGNLSVDEIFREAGKRSIELISITDHDSIGCQQQAMELANKRGVRYITGVELNVAFSHPKYRGGKSIALDFLGYQYDLHDQALVNKLQKIRRYREERAQKILDRLNAEFEKEDLEKFTEADIKAIQDTVEGSFGRPHIANYLVKRGIVKTKNEAFDKYLMKCNVPKYPLHLEDASKLIRDAGGLICFAHPNDPHGTSLVDLTSSLAEQSEIIEEAILEYIDGVECWHSRNDTATTEHYIKFAEKRKLILTGGSDCHQKPIIMGTVKIPNYVAKQFD